MSTKKIKTMKKFYQIPEIELHVMEKFCGIEDGSNGDGESDPLSNENKTFDEGELSTDVNKSGLWDD